MAVSPLPCQKMGSHFFFAPYTLPDIGRAKLWVETRAQIGGSLAEGLGGGGAGGGA